MVELIKINMTREHEKSRSDQVLTWLGRSGEPRTSDDASTVGPDVIAALGLLTKMINEGSKFWPLSSKQGFTV